MPGATLSAWSFLVPNYPPLPDVEIHIRLLRTALRNAGVPDKIINSIQTKALRTGRKQTGQWRTNRESRWSLVPQHPQYGSEHDCKIILVKLCGTVFCFDNAPNPPDDVRVLIEQFYVDHAIESGTYKDSLLLEAFDFKDLVTEGLEPTHGHSSFHIGHTDPTMQPKHRPDNVTWRTKRSNLIQGDMTLRQARIYFVKLIARYFELGELDIN